MKKTDWERQDYWAMNSAVQDYWYEVMIQDIKGICLDCLHVKQCYRMQNLEPDLKECDGFESVHEYHQGGNK